jgi:hypothetical protein
MGFSRFQAQGLMMIGTTRMPSSWRRAMSRVSSSA